MKKLLTTPTMVKVEISLFEDIIKIIANAIHPQVTGGQLQGVLNNLISLREKSISDHEKNKELGNAT